MSWFFKLGRSWLLGFSLILIISLSVGGVRAAEPQQIASYGSPQSPISAAIAVPANRAYFWTSGTVPPVLDSNASAGSRERYGDTKTQAIGTLRNIETQLKNVGLNLSNVTYLRVYLVADKFNDNKVDYQGWFDAYGQFFNTVANPVKTARSTLAVAGLVNPDWLIEIEAVAVFPK